MPPISRDSTERFTDRVENYVRYRPGYPPAVPAILRERAQLTRQSVVADIGSGTGILTALLLPAVRRVHAVEPNAAMRAAAEERLGRHAGFFSVAATAESTTLASASIDLVTAGQAFHWFEPRACRTEFARILRPGGRVALVWNRRLTDATPFLSAYELLLHSFIPEVERTNLSHIDEDAIRAFFLPARFEKIETPNEQSFDRSGLIGRTLSASYAPNPGQPGHEQLVAGLERLFAVHARAGRVAMLYRTCLYLGALD